MTLYAHIVNFIKDQPARFPIKSQQQARLAQSVARETLNLKVVVRAPRRNFFLDPERFDFNL